MSMKLTMILSASALALAACGPKTETANGTDAMANGAAFDAGNAGVAATGTTAATPAATGGQVFANGAAASDAFEIATSRLALDNSNSAAVKKYANQMIAAHTASTDKLKATTAGLSPAITPDPTLNAEQQAQLDGLKTKKGAEFDTAYIAAQQSGHQQTLDMLRGYAATGDVPALKTFASGLVPTVAAHLNMAKGLKA
jgi:putative membrane protein